jgi:hypothetical protein
MPQDRGHELGEWALIHSFGMCAAKAPPLHSGGAFAPLHPRRWACLPLDPAQPCAGWMRARAFPPWTWTRKGLAPPRPPAPGLPRPGTHGQRFPAGRERAFSPLDHDALRGD